MSSKFFVPQERAFKMLSQESLEQINQATLKILQSKGVMFKDKDALNVLRDAGANVDSNIVRFPEHLIIDSIEKCPESFILKARNPKYDILLGSSSVNYTNGFGATQIFDLEKSKVRDAKLKDLINFTRLANKLSEVGFCMIGVTPNDIPPGSADLYGAWALLKYTDKNIHISIENEANLEKILEMTELVGKEIPDERKPFFSLGATSNSPLTYTEDSCKRILFASRLGVPVFVVCGGISGVTLPVTFPGALAVQNAEVLAGIVLAQATNPGVPCVYGAFTGPMDLKTVKLLLGSPQLAMFNVCTTQLCRKYKIPHAYGTGGVSDAKIPGLQAGIEKALTVLTATLAGVEVIHDGVSGLLDGALLASLEQMVIDNEMCKMIRYIIKDIEINDDSLALDVINEVAHGGNFLGHSHTVQHFREEIYMNELLLNAGNDNKSGKLQDVMLTGANKFVKEFIEQSPIENIISPEIEKKLDDFLPDSFQFNK